MRSLLFKIQNRSNETAKHSDPRELETSHLYQVGWKESHLLRPSTSLTVYPQLGMVPIKQSFFAKLTAQLDQYVIFKGTGLINRTKAGIVAGKNVAVNDKIEYRPLSRAQMFIRNKTKFYLFNYPHIPLYPKVLTTPYTYLEYFLSHDIKRKSPTKHELEFGVGWNFVGQH